MILEVSAMGKRGGSTGCKSHPACKKNDCLNFTNEPGILLKLKGRLPEILERSRNVNENKQDRYESRDLTEK